MDAQVKHGGARVDGIQLSGRISNAGVAITLL